MDTCCLTGNKKYMQFEIISLIEKDYRKLKKLSIKIITILFDFTVSSHVDRESQNIAYCMFIKL